MASSVAEATRTLENNHVDLVITDLKMPGLGGEHLVRHVRENFSDTEVMIITGYPSVKGAVEAVKTGAEDYLKTFTEEELLSTVERTLRKTSHSEGCAYESSKPRVSVSHGLAGESRAMVRIGEFISKVALTLATVLISGESGTGKELACKGYSL